MISLSALCRGLRIARVRAALERVQKGLLNRIGCPKIPPTIIVTTIIIDRAVATLLEIILETGAAAGPQIFGETAPRREEAVSSRFPGARGSRVSALLLLLLLIIIIIIILIIIIIITIITIITLILIVVISTTIIVITRVVI